MDKWSSGAHESDPKRGNRQTISLRFSRSTKQHLYAFVMAYNFAKRLKTLRGLTPYEYFCQVWTKDPDRFKIDPTQHIVGLNT